ncbi:hypothetical protein SAMN02745823_02191 [Sporobacter termitidis DSM 10068]|uniref:Uncharacterized protein n=2 Tax=Sporobacter TaxID=44748 RepID=A0A1M5Y3S1_9FIRM|nr:hypothetical protein SAMN02745823_02191 [Sporobacter termitidis DSM 10068]
MTAVLAGCGKPIALETAYENNAAITSYSYFVDFNVKLSNAGEVEDTAVQFNMNGKLSSAADRIKTRADVSAVVDGEPMKFPVYLDTSAKEFDFDIFVGIPDVIRDSFAGKTDFYLSSAQLETLMQLALTPEEYKDFENTLQTYSELGTRSSGLSAAIESSVQSYLTNNSGKIQKFESLEGKKVSENGTYSFTLSKEDLKAILTEFFSNEDNYQLVKDEYGAFIARLGQEAFDEFEEMPDAETLIKEISEAMDALKALDLNAEFTIEDSYITGLSLSFTGIDDTGEQIDLAFTLLLSDINKSVNITVPDKNADTNLDIVALLKDALPAQQNG